MDKLCAAHAEEARNLFQTHSSRRASWDPIREKETAKIIRLLRLTDLDEDITSTEGKDDEQDRDLNNTVPKTSTSNSASPSRGSKTVQLDIKIAANRDIA